MPWCNENLVGSWQPFCIYKLTGSGFQKQKAEDPNCSHMWIYAVGSLKLSQEVWGNNIRKYIQTHETETFY